MAVATDKVIVAKQLKKAGLNGFRVHRVEHVGDWTIALIVCGEWALTARLERAALVELTIGWTV